MNKITLILGICCVVFLALWLRSCQAKPPDNSAQDKKVDSINAVLKVHDSFHIHAIDSLSLVAKIATNSKDSAIKEVILMKGSLKSKDKDIADLVGELNGAQERKDTAEIMTLCDSLKRAYPVAKGLVTAYILKNDSLQVLNTQIIGAKDTIISHLNSMFTETNNSLFNISREYGILSENYKKEVKKASKRFGFGPEVTVGIVGSKFVIAPGVGLHYSLIKF